MKTILFRLILILSSATLVGNNVYSEKEKIEKKKVYKKEFNVQTNSSLAIDNEYGNVNITTWNENRISIEITVTAKCKDEDKADKKLNDIKIYFNQNGLEVSAKTIVESGFSWIFFKTTPVEFDINYVVKMPVTNHLNVTNDYGFIYLDKLSGNCTLNSSYGGLSIGQLLSNSNKINLNYSKITTIQFLKSGSISADYSLLKIEKADELNLVSNYSTTKLNDINKITFEAEYGELTIQKALVISGKSNYLSMNIEELSKKLKLNLTYGAFKINKIASGFESVLIDSEYTDIKLGLDENTNNSFDLRIEYGSIGFDGISPTFTENESNGSLKIKKGYTGVNSTNALIKVNSEYGNIRIYKN